MSIIITKGLPMSLLVGLSQNNSPVAINDGTWVTDVSLRHKTERGAEPFDLTLTPSANSIVVDISSLQTATLDHRDNQYVLVIKASKSDGTVNLRNTLQVSVKNDL